MLMSLAEMAVCMMVSPLSAGLAGSNSMAAYPGIMFRLRFRETLVCVSNLFPLVNKRGPFAEPKGSLLPPLPLGRIGEHRYFPLNESSYSLHIKGYPRDLETELQQSAVSSGMIRIRATSKVDVTKTAGNET